MSYNAKGGSEFTTTITYDGDSFDMDPGTVHENIFSKFFMVPPLKVFKLTDHPRTANLLLSMNSSSYIKMRK